MAIGFNTNGLVGQPAPGSGTPPIGTYIVNSWGLAGSYISAYFDLLGGEYKNQHQITVGASPTYVYSYHDMGGCFSYRYA